MPFLFSSCSDGDDLPVAYFNFDERGGTQHGGALCIRNGDSRSVITAGLNKAF